MNEARWEYVNHGDNVSNPTKLCNEAKGQARNDCYYEDPGNELLPLLRHIVRSDSKKGINDIFPRLVRCESSECLCDDDVLLLLLHPIRSESKKYLDDANRSCLSRTGRCEKWEDGPMTGQCFVFVDAFGKRGVIVEGRV